MENNNRQKIPIVLTIAGSDPSGGAGIEADVKTLTSLGAHAMALPTLQTVQNTLGVREVRFLDPDFLQRQFDCLMEDLFPQAVKIGAVGNRAMLNKIIQLLSRPDFKKVPIVIDTVIKSTSGADMLAQEALDEFRTGLLPLATVITPNVPELSALSCREVTRANAEEELRRFGEDKSYAILLKGGHFSGDPMDFLLLDGRIHSYPSTRIKTRHTHGTGCALASALAAFLSLGHELTAAVPLAQTYVIRSLKEAPGLGQGHGPLNFRVS